MWLSSPGKLPQVCVSSKPLESHQCSFLFQSPQKVFWSSLRATSIDRIRLLLEIFCFLIGISLLDTLVVNLWDPAALLWEGKYQTLVRFRWLSRWQCFHFKLNFCEVKIISLNLRCYLLVFSINFTEVKLQNQLWLFGVD